MRSRVALSCNRVRGFGVGNRWGVSFDWPAVPGGGAVEGFQFHARLSEGFCGGCGKEAERVTVDGDVWLRCRDGWRGLVFRMEDGEAVYHLVPDGVCILPVGTVDP